MSHVAPPFKEEPFDPKKLQGFLNYSNQANPLDQANAFLDPDPQVKRQALLGLGNKLPSDATNFIPPDLRSQLADILRHQTDLAYQITFIIEEDEKPNNNSSLTQSLTQGLTQSLALKTSPLLKNNNRFTLPNAPLVSLNMKNKIISKTSSRRPQSTDGAPLSQGSIKERWSLEDVQINISGILLFQINNQYPVTQVQQLYRLLQQGQAAVEHLILNTLGITHLVIESIALPPTKSNNQKYQIKALSDRSDYSLLSAENL